MDNMTKTCSSCSNAIFDPLWGEYKCKKLGIYCYMLPNNCKDYTHGVPDISEEHPDYYEEE